MKGTNTTTSTINTSPKKTERDKSIWNDLSIDPVSGIKTISQCVSIYDIFGDGDNRLIAAEVTNQRLKVFKGGALQNELKLNFVPVSVVCFSCMENATKTSTIIIYK